MEVNAAKPASHSTTFYVFNNNQFDGVLGVQDPSLSGAISLWSFKEQNGADLFATAQNTSRYAYSIAALASDAASTTNGTRTNNPGQGLNYSVSFGAYLEVTVTLGSLGLDASNYDVVFEVSGTTPNTHYSSSYLYLELTVTAAAEPKYTVVDISGLPVVNSQWGAEGTGGITAFVFDAEQKPIANEPQGQALSVELRKTIDVDDSRRLSDGVTTDVTASCRSIWESCADDSSACSAGFRVTCDVPDTVHAGDWYVEVFLDSTVVLNATAVSMKCYEGQYSEDDKCKTCQPPHTCLTGTTIETIDLADGYWRACTGTSDCAIFECTFGPNACIGGNKRAWVEGYSTWNKTSQKAVLTGNYKEGFYFGPYEKDTRTSYCKEGYYGPLCQSCQIGASSVHVCSRSTPPPLPSLCALISWLPTNCSSRADLPRVLTCHVNCRLVFVGGRQAVRPLQPRRRARPQDQATARICSGWLSRICCLQTVPQKNRVAQSDRCRRNRPSTVDRGRETRTQLQISSHGEPAQPETPETFLMVGTARCNLASIMREQGFNYRLYVSSDLPVRVPRDRAGDFVSLPLACE